MAINNEEQAAQFLNDGRYIFDNAGSPARARVDTLSTLYDPNTIKLLQARGIRPGWRCLEIGAGNGSIARWLAEQVGPTGYVLATDINTRFLNDLTQPGIEVRQHDIVNDALPEQAFDIIHTRLVLHHLPGRDRALERIIKALKPGGWVVLEEFDTQSLSPTITIDTAALVWKTQATMLELMARQGVDRFYGRRLPGLLHAHGLRELGVDGSFTLWRGATPSAHLQRANYEQLREELLGSGLLSADELDHDLARLDDPESILLSPLLFSVWGQRPS